MKITRFIKLTFFLMCVSSKNILIHSLPEAQMNWCLNAKNLNGHTFSAFNQFSRVLDQRSAVEQNLGVSIFQGFSSFFEV